MDDVSPLLQYYLDIVAEVSENTCFISLKRFRCACFQTSHLRIFVCNNRNNGNNSTFLHDPKRKGCNAVP